MPAVAFYKNSVGNRLIIECGCTVTGATGIVLYVRKPSGVEQTWTGLTVNGTTRVAYVTQTGNLDETGVYSCQPFMTLPGGFVGRGRTFSFPVLDYFG